MLSSPPVRIPASTQRHEMANNGESRFSQWRSSGLVATVAWFALLIAYVIFRWQGIEDPLLVNTFNLFTGAYASFLTMGIAKKSEKSNGNNE